MAELGQQMMMQLIRPAMMPLGFRDEVSGFRVSGSKRGGRGERQEEEGEGGTRGEGGGGAGAAMQGTALAELDHCGGPQETRAVAPRAAAGVTARVLS